MAKTRPNVLGQADFTHLVVATTQSGIHFPIGVTYVPATSQLFVSDNANNRIMIFDGSTISSPVQWDLIHGYE
jgi:DNA-binding beta-propeller fold protein YncE